MEERSIFYEDWRACLRAHYIYVLRVADVDNESSLYTVLRDTGFNDEEIMTMRVEAGIVDVISEAAVIEEEVEPEAESAAEVVMVAAIEQPAIFETQLPIMVEPPTRIIPRQDEPPAQPLVQRSLF